MLQAAIVAGLTALQPTIYTVQVQPSESSHLGGVPCSSPASAPVLGKSQRHLLALPDAALTQPELDNVLMRESLEWILQQRLMLQEGSLLSTDLVAPGRGLSQFVFPAGGMPQEALLVERIQQVGPSHIL